MEPNIKIKNTVKKDSEFDPLDENPFSGSLSTLRLPEKDLYS